MLTIRQELKTGVIFVELDEAGSWTANELFGIAERINPKRSFLFVSNVLGRYVPVKPSKMRKVYKELAFKLPKNLPEPVLFVGIAETAVGFGAGIYEEASKNISKSIYLTSTRHRIDGELICEFKEEHSHATDHLIYLPKDEELVKIFREAKTLVLLDDEATTGNTFKNLYNALKENSLKNIEEVVAVTITDWSGDALMNHIDVPITQVSLLKGKWKWEPKQGAVLPELPNVNVSKAGYAKISELQDWGRFGMTSKPSNHLIEEDYSFVNAGEKVLILGSAEFVYIPFLIAEKLESKGVEAYFSSTSRSPIQVGSSINSIMSFRDNYGLGISNFCYNVADKEFDRIILCTETDIHFWDSKFIKELNMLAKSGLHIMSYKEEGALINV